MTLANDPGAAQEGTDARQTGQETTDDLREPQAATGAADGRTGPHPLISAGHCDACLHTWYGADDKPSLADMVRAVLEADTPA
ncbi:hypothetical protein ABZ312_11565 [Streptomyces sp. NPDC006207]